MTLVAWIDPADDGRRTESAGRVTAITDKSPSSNNVVEESGSGPPTATIDTKTALDFTNSGDRLVRPSGSVTGIDGPDVSVVVAYTDDGVAAGGNRRGLIGYTNALFNDGWLLQKNAASSAIEFGVEESGGGLEVAGGASTSNIDIIAARFDSARDFAEIIKNGGTLADSKTRAITLVTPQELSIGDADGSGSYPWLSGNICDLIVFDGVLSYDEIQRLEGFLANKWTATDVLPIAHPFKTVAPDIVVGADLVANFTGVGGQASGYTAETGQTATFLGNAQLDDAQFRFGPTALLCDGSGDAVTFPDSDSWHFAAQDFTVELWVRFNPASGGQSFMAQWSGSSNRGWIFEYLATDDLRFIWSLNGTNLAFHVESWSPVADTWYHLAFVRDGNTSRLYVDGAQLGSESSEISGDTLHNSTLPLGIGGRSNGSNSVDGNVDSARVMKGTALYQHEFDVPHRGFVLPVTAQLIANFNGPDAATAYTSEDSAQRIATFVGNSQLDTAEKRFGHASLLLDGSGDVVTFPDSPDWDLSAEDFTIEFWVRFSTDPGTSDNLFVAHWTSAGNQRAWALSLSANNLQWNWTTDGTLGTAAVISGAWNPSGATWYHMAVEKYNGEIVIYVDGAIITGPTANAVTYFSATAPLDIGARDSGGSQNVNGRIDGVRIVKGTGLYKATAFAVPVAGQGEPIV